MHLDYNQNMDRRLIPILFVVNPGNFGLLQKPSVAIVSSSFCKSPPPYITLSSDINKKFLVLDNCHSLIYQFT